jgi:hypothetical protein
MDLLKDDPAFDYSSALLAIHGAISYCDALRTGLGEDQVVAEDHQRASAQLRQLLSARRYEKLDGVDRLAKLLGNKSAIAYGTEIMGAEKLRSVIQQAERFAVWAEAAGIALRIEGWRDDNN